MKPRQYFKDFCLVMNSDPVVAREQIDVRRLPPYYAHRKVSEALQRRMQDLKLEKERKFRTTLQDHLLFGIICDSKKFNKSKKHGDGTKKEEEVQEREDEKQEEEGVDWTKVMTEAHLEEEEKVVQAKPAKDDKRDNVYDKSLPFADDAPLLIHRLLHSLNYEYVFFVNEAGTKEIGVFIVLLEALAYK